MREIKGFEKKEYIKYINTELYPKKQYDYYFLGEKLVKYDIVKISSDRNYLMIYSWDKQEKCYNVDYLRLTDKDTPTLIEVLKDFEDMISTKPCKAMCCKNNTRPYKFLEKLYKRYEKQCVKYFIGNTMYLYFKPKVIKKKILSIDIDFFFKDMNLFQELFNVNTSPKLSWKMVESGLKKKYKKSLSDCMPDLDSVRFVNDILVSKCTGATKVKIMEHDKIIEIMEKENCVKSDVWNIDFHHDKLQCRE